MKADHYTYKLQLANLERRTGCKVLEFTPDYFIATRNENIMKFELAKYDTWHDIEESIENNS